MVTVLPETYGAPSCNAAAGAYGNLSQFQQGYQDRFDAASRALGQAQLVRLVPTEIEKIVEAVVARLARLVDPQKLAEELAPIC